MSTLAPPKRSLADVEAMLQHLQAEREQLLQAQAPPPSEPSGLPDHGSWALSQRIGDFDGTHVGSRILYPTGGADCGHFWQDPPRDLDSRLHLQFEYHRVWLQRIVSICDGIRNALRGNVHGIRYKWPKMWFPEPSLPFDHSAGHPSLDATREHLRGLASRHRPLLDALEADYATLLYPRPSLAKLREEVQELLGKINAF